jgi:3-oxoadipate enol-lactonase
MSDDGVPDQWATTVAGTGRTFLLLPPNPTDASSWLYQSTRFARWFRTVAVDLPGYGRSPALTGPVTMSALADAAWRVADRSGSREPIVIGGISIGASLALHMARLRPRSVAALVLSGCSYAPGKPFAARRIAGYRSRGRAYREEHIRDGHSAAFGRTAVGRYLSRLARDRADLMDVASVIRLFEAHGAEDPPELFIPGCPVLIITGSEDYAHDGARALQKMIDGAEMVVIDGAGHVCNIERPDAWDAATIDFLTRHSLIAAAGRPPSD